jgi:molybdate transport repressor ModE-like protein
MKKHSSENLEEELNIENLKKRVGFGIKFWLEFQDSRRENILGSGWANLLESIYKTNDKGPNSLTQAAKECGYSYKYAWNILNKIKSRTGKSPVETKRGGTGGGGWVELNEWGLFLITTYRNLSTEIEVVEKKLKKNYDNFREDNER